MRIETRYRHEWKHEISYGDLMVLRQRLRAVMEQDEHAAGGSYRIRSLYFDNLEDKALREKVDGVNLREKFRIRCYNEDYSVIHLEKKAKRGGLGCKFSADLSVEETRALLQGETAWMTKSGRPLVQELGCKMRSQGLRPMTLVDYTREPYIYRQGNVRVTMDYDIRTGLKSIDFLNPEAVTIPAGDEIVLEVKWDEYLPDIIRDLVWLPGRRAGAFSKYAECRRYG